MSTSVQVHDLTSHMNRKTETPNEEEMDMNGHKDGELQEEVDEKVFEPILPNPPFQQVNQQQ